MFCFTVSPGLLYSKTFHFLTPLSCPTVCCLIMPTHIVYIYVYIYTCHNFKLERDMIGQGFFLMQEFLNMDFLFNVECRIFNDDIQHFLNASF